MSSKTPQFVGLTIIAVVVAIAALTIFGPSIGGNPFPREQMTDAEKEELLTQTSTAESRWATHNIENYAIDVEYSNSWCGGQSFHLEVRQGIVESTPVGSSLGAYCDPQNRTWIELVSPAVYEWIRQRVATSSLHPYYDRTEVEFDLIYGYPTRIRKLSPTSTDSEYIYEFSNFKPINP